jgi:hypothetical protein
LVTIGSLHGALTAAHVLDALPKKGAVGIVTSVDRPSDFQKQIVMMENTEEVVIRGKDFGPIGPDLGFLRLPEESLGWLKAKNSFYNLPKRRPDVLARKEPTASHVDSIIGIIHEFTKDAPTGRPSERRKEFTAIFCGAHLAALRYPASYELYYYEPITDPGFALPKSFKGTSGGAIWRFYVAEMNGSINVVDQRLIAVPFYESLSLSGKREITCHGPQGIYGVFIDTVTEKWPKEAKAGGD